MKLLMTFSGTRLSCAVTSNMEKRLKSTGVNLMLILDRIKNLHCKCSPYTKQHKPTFRLGFLPSLGSVTELVVETATLCRAGVARDRKSGQNGQTQTQTQKAQHFVPHPMTS